MIRTAGAAWTITCNIKQTSSGLQTCCYLLHWTMDNWTYCFFFNFQLLRKWSVQVGVCHRNGDRANTNTISNFGEIQLVLWIRRGECARSGTDTLQTGEIHVMSADTSWFALSTLSWYTGSQLAGRPLIYNLAGKFQWKLNCSCLLICFAVYVRYHSKAPGSWFTTRVPQAFIR